MEKYEGKLVMAEYLPKGSLYEYITDTSREPQWGDRFRIITGICHGLYYLHQNNVVHVDLKPTNILLDNNLVAKIADFGLSRCFGEMQSRIITLNSGGTFGYLPPEFGNGEITYKYDIFSLGVIIVMEILTGKKGYHDVDKVVESWSELLEKSQREVQQEQVRVCAEIGIKCIDSNPANRPNMRQIVNRLDKTKTVDVHIETSMITSQQKDLVFRVKNEQGYELNQLRELNSVSPSMVARLASRVNLQEPLEASQAAEEGLTEWEPSGRRCSAEVEANVLEGFCPPVGLKKLSIYMYGDSNGEEWCGKGYPKDLQELDQLKIFMYEGSKYPDWMVGKQNGGGRKDLEELDLFARVRGPAPPIVEAFPHLHELSIIGDIWDALPSNMEHLTSLKKLFIGHNDSIRSLPTFPRSLEEIHLFLCDDKFIKSCLTVGHPNWQKIKDIPKMVYCRKSEPTALERMQLKVGNFWRGLTM